MKQEDIEIEKERIASARAVAIGVIAIIIVAILAIAAIIDALEERKEFLNYCDTIMIA